MMLYKIGEFSKITSLTVKALRYYDEEGILQPSTRAESGYRLYEAGDFEKAMLIVLMRELDFSIAEIKDVLANCTDNADLHFYLREKKTAIAGNVEKEKELIKRIDLYISPDNRKTEEIVMSYKFEIRNIPAMQVVSIRYTGGFSEIGSHIGSLFKAAKGQASGAPIMLYHDDEYKEIADMEICLPVKRKITAGEIKSKELPAIKALTTTHLGKYENFNLAYKAIYDYSKEKGLTLSVPCRETYCKGPGMIFRGNPDKYVTEIAIPVQ
jgi:DNA-binding transcriptional MerR regulator